MKLRRLELSNFRRFVDKVAVSNLGDGLTVIAGDNEEGKSTLLKALRTVLFDRHRLSGEAAEALKPFGSEVRPEVALDFELEGRTYKLRKGFCQQAFAEMDTPTGRLHGPAVEEALQQLLRFEPPGKGAAKTEHQGIWGLFWLEQGTGFANLTLQGRARHTVLSALEGEVGAVLGGQRGRELLDVIGRRYAEHFDARHNPRGDFKKARERVEELKIELEKVQAELKGYDAKVDELARVRERLRRYEAEERLGRAVRDREEAEKEQRRIESLATRLQAARQEEQVARAVCSAALISWQRREAELRSLIEADAAVKKRELSVAAEREALLPQAELLKQARQDFDAAQKAQEHAEAQAKRWERAEKRARVAESLTELRRKEAAAARAIEQHRQAQSRAQTIAVDEKKLRALRRLDGELREAEAGLSAVATRLSFDLKEGVELRLAGRRLAAGQPLLMTEPTTVELCQKEERLGLLTITPGAEDLSERMERAEAARQKLADELAGLRVADVAAAEVAATERAELQAQAQQQQQLLLAYAPEGIEALREAVARAEAELAAAGEPQEALSTEELHLRLRGAQAELEEAQKNTKRLRAIWDKESQALRAAEGACTQAEAELHAAQGTQKRAREVLQAARLRDDDAQLGAAVEEGKAQLQTVVAATEAASRALADAAPEEARLRLESKIKAVEMIRGELDTTAKLASELEIELRTLGQHGLGEKAQELYGELEQARAVAARFEREAAATRLLYKTLQDAEREAKESFMAPIKRRVQPYLNLLLPGSELLLTDSDLSISHLRRSGKDEPFESLSVGTREQLAVLCRLAFADLLREQGHPAPIVLDDALVYADDARFERMLYVLRRAAQHQQILVLTCRERDYLSAGFPVLRLSTCAVA